MGILRSDRVSGLGGANAITGSTFFAGTANTGNYLRIDTGATEDFTFGTGDFTIEFWVNSQGSGFQQHFYDGRGTTNSQRLLIYMDNNNTMYYFDGTANRIQSSSALPIGDWVHVALVRASATTKLYWNGTQTGSTHTSDTVDFLAPPQGHAFIGSNGGTDGIEPSGGGYFNGFLSNYRIVKGTGVYTANFTTPNTRLAAIDGTVLLTCTSSGNVSKTEGGNDVQPSTKNNNSTPPTASHFVPDVGEDHGTKFEDNTKFDTLSYMVPPGGTTTERGRGRGLRFGGDTPSKTNAVDYIQIQSGGISQDFGDLLTTLTQAHGGSSSTRLVIFGGYNAPANVADIQYITMATTGNSVDSGINIGSDLTSYIHVASNETRAVYGGGTPITNTLEYVTIASLSSSTDFGDLTLGGMFKGAEMSSSTRGVFAGGYYPAQSLHIQYITIGTTGNSTDFGDLLAANSSPGGICSSPIRGIIWNNTNSIHYITIATTGDATEFGEASVDGFNAGATFSSHTRGCAAGGYNQPSPGSGSNASQNWIDSVEIASVGNAKDFGDLTTLISSTGGGSDCHGGLS